MEMHHQLVKKFRKNRIAWTCIINKYTELVQGHTVIEGPVETRNDRAKSNTGIHEPHCSAHIWTYGNIHTALITIHKREY